MNVRGKGENKITKLALTEMLKKVIVIFQKCYIKKDI